MNDKASRFDANDILQEISIIKREPVSDRLIRHCIKDGNVDQHLSFKDYIGNIGVRLNIHRDDYKIPTGLYRFGKPDEHSEVLVTGNYKLTFDYLRRYLKKNYHVLIIDTDGINVWCAAGKGRFGTAEVVRMLKSVTLPVNHNRIILPQLSGPGIQSDLITKLTGKKVYFGPVRIQDMDTYIENGIQPGMREVTFTLWERAKVMPLEIVHNLNILIAAWLIALLPFVPFEVFKVCIGAVIIGTVIFPVLLPILPFRMFYKNGFLLSVLLFLTAPFSILNLGFIMLGMLYASILAMGFTGSTTFTSLTGVTKELDEAIPRMIKWGILSAFVVIVGIIMEVI